MRLVKFLRAQLETIRNIGEHIIPYFRGAEGFDAKESADAV